MGTSKVYDSGNNQWCHDDPLTCGKDAVLFRMCCLMGVVRIGMEDARVVLGCTYGDIMELDAFACSLIHNTWIRDEPDLTETDIRCGKQIAGRVDTVTRQAAFLREYFLRCLIADARKLRTFTVRCRPLSEPEVAIDTVSEACRGTFAM
ncbi:hypothetical protein H9L39_07746 [Fusarium oxysporum f. sp. albedinis]|nr:hypothetical protein FOZG_04664 [Fusarium oxysporum Fo47]KAK2482107.1 hypothetical protein H9L39_07746 [Fusarium oxysporum f. sp. albedinis]